MNKKKKNTNISGTYNKKKGTKIIEETASVVGGLLCLLEMFSEQ